MTLPLVLAGPVVRRVEPRSVTVWVALSEAADVSLTVWPGIRMAGPDAGTVAPAAAPLGSGTTATRRFGTHLHIGLGTLELTPPSAAMTPQAIHSYDLGFDGAFGATGLRDQGLLHDETSGERIAGVHPDAPLHLALGYMADRLPSFVTPAASVGRLRLAHASCRKPHGPADAMAYLDEELEDRLLDTDERVQQLVLTGDQIYADDVASVLLDMLDGLGRELLGGEERLEVSDGTTIPATLENFPAVRRQRLVQELAGFTSGSASDHLLSFGEYAAMYCAVWSSRVWRTLAPPARS